MFKHNIISKYFPMKKSIVFFFMLLCSIVSAYAQSSMSDDQVIKFVLKEQEKGTKQQDIAVKLVQRGVTTEQMQRVRKKAERLKNKQGLGTTENALFSKEEVTRLRKTKSEENINEVITHLMADTAKIEQSRIIFGHELFQSKDLTFEPAMNIATPNNYVIGAGDNIFVDIYGASQKTAECIVSPDGYIVIEEFGPVQVAGLTVEQANKRVRSKLGSRYANSSIQLSVGQTRTISVNVMGEVVNPGTYTLSAFATVFHALYMAGGPSEIGTLRNIKVYRSNRLVSTVDVYDYILNGKLSGNIRLQDDDVITVGAYDCLVNITGKVKRPMFYEMKRNESMKTLINYAGGFSGDAYRKSVRVVRKEGTQFSVFTVGEFDMASFRLADEDSVSVDSILPRYSNMVEVKGAVFRPGMFQLGEQINSVKSLLEAAEGVTEEAFLNHAVMHRMKADRTLEVLSVDLESLLNGTIADIPLRNEDVLFVPSRQEFMVEQTLTIKGEVHYPGVYQYAENETLEDFVLQAGGLTESASAVNVTVSRRTKNPKANARDSILSQTFTFSLKDGFVINGEPGFHLQPFDEVYVHRSPGYNYQKNVQIEGQVMFAGTYTLSKQDERLSDLVKKAGGVSQTAYIGGARLERKMNEAERLRYEESLKMQMQQQEITMMEMAMRSGRSISDISTALALKTEREVVPEYYSVGIELDKALKNPGCDADLVLREGDRLIIPTYTGTVKISGEVRYPNTVGFQKGKKAKYYINQAGGFSNVAKKKQAYVVYMNGDVATVKSGAKIMPGCEIVVPQRSINKMTTSETIALGTGIASVTMMLVTLINTLSK
jgi:protein involved in polysaccharide export with SLBB domain